MSDNTSATRIWAIGKHEVFFAISILYCVYSAIAFLLAFFVSPYDLSALDVKVLF